MTPSARPHVTLKIATSLDGRIATASGESKWITGEQAREQVHRLRAEHHVVLVGSGTVLADDPLLTVRLPGYDGSQPLRVVADGRLRTQLRQRMYRSATETAPVCVLSRYEGKREDGRLYTGAARALEYLEAGPGMMVSHCEPDKSGLGLEPKVIVRRTIDNLALLEPPRETLMVKILLEGGGTLAASFLRDDLIDRIEWFRAPIILGAEGRPALGDLGIEKLAAAPRFQRVAVKELGQDLWESYVRRPAAL